MTHFLRSGKSALWILALAGPLRVTPAVVSVAMQGTGLLPETHLGEVSTLQVDDPNSATGVFPAGIQLPVTVAVLSGIERASRTVNGVRIKNHPGTVTHMSLRNLSNCRWI